MPTGRVQITVRDGGLGLSTGQNPNATILLGVCAATNTPQVMSFSQVGDIIAPAAAGGLLAGPLAEAAAYQVTVAGGAIYVCPINASVAASISAWSPQRAASSNGTISTYGAGLPNNNYNIRVLVVSLGTGQTVISGRVAIKVSLDNGVSYGNQILVPTTGIVVLQSPVVGVTTGVSVNLSLSTSTFDAGDYFTATCTQPYFSTTDLQNALTEIQGSNYQFAKIGLIGFASGGTNYAVDYPTLLTNGSVALASTLVTGMAALEAAQKPTRGYMAAPDRISAGFPNVSQATEDSDLMTAFVNAADTRLRVSDGTAVITSVISGAQMVQGANVPLLARLALIAASRSPGIPDDGALPGLISISHDERKDPGMYDFGFSTLLTITGRSGFYCDTGRAFAPQGSDYSLDMNGLVMDEVQNASYQGALHFLNTTIRTDASGNILASDAVTIEKYMVAKIMAAAGTDINGQPIVAVTRNNNILSTSNLKVTVRVVPYGYASLITLDLGYYNPSLAI